jgi:hypothetical protein
MQIVQNFQTEPAAISANTPIMSEKEFCCSFWKQTIHEIDTHALRFEYRFMNDDHEG